MLRLPEQIDHWYGTSFGDVLRHDSVPLFKSQLLQLNSAQLDQVCRDFLALEPQLLGFGRCLNDSLMSLAATGGGLVFGGDANGRFHAFDDETGQILWKVNLGSPVSGFPISFAVDGKQYVAVSTGSSLVVAGTTGGLTPELETGSARNMFVFGLP